MSTTARYETAIEADPKLPIVRITRDFDATPDRVFRAFVEPDLVARWLGPDETGIRIDAWEARTGGNYRYVVTKDDGEEVAAFYGSFHEVRPSGRIVQTQTFEAIPDGVALETLTLEDIGDGRTRVTSTTVMESFEARDGLIASGMESGVLAGYATLDGMLADGVV
ncbi:MAG: SRPBCC family protein [Streptosporangiales bacterium]|nr:SRPBCC family protein [Streptosporangiales bacterium]MBO0891731.1 SRPBCC family protein [Acidothermales bacterium]